MKKNDNEIAEDIELEMEGAEKVAETSDNTEDPDDFDEIFEPEDDPDSSLSEEVAQDSDDDETTIIYDSDRDAIKKPRDKKLLYGVFGVAAAALIGLCVYSLVAKRPVEPEPVSTNTVAEVDEDNPYSQENIIKQLDEQQLPLYEYMITGKHTASDPDSDTGVAIFNFKTNDRFFGRSSDIPDDVGTYSVTAEDGKVIVTIECLNVTDRYVVSISDTDNIILTDESNGKIYALSEAE